MYFPYLRGRQYELLALRELVEKDAISKKVIPIIEPVKLSATLLKTMDAFIKNNRQMIVICNPAVGNFVTDMKTDDKNQEQFLSLLKSEEIIKGHIMKKMSAQFIDIWKDKMGVNKEDWVVLNNKREFVDEYSNIFAEQPPKFVLIPDESNFRRKTREGNNRVLLADRFNKLDRNSDYSKNEDEFYSDDHLYYDIDGYRGFSDYSIIGNDYLESGFAPYAVAIHIIYLKKDDSLWVHHFVSDSNDDIQNPAKKFYEAVSKLADWCEIDHIDLTIGLKTFIEHYHNQTYPGLGSVKKLSLMHHIELLSKLLDGVK